MKTFKQDEMWWEPLGTVHMVSRNASKKKNERNCWCFLLENRQGGYDANALGSLGACKEGTKSLMEKRLGNPELITAKRLPAR